MKKQIILWMLASLGSVSSAVSGLEGNAGLPPAEQLQTWVSEMKQAPRGPFKRIRWFCADGTVLPPKAFACAPHGGGRQHGEWTDRVKSMRADGYKIANVMAEYLFVPITDAEDYADTFKQIQVERYLVAADDGWILRQARSYRGAFQEEDERNGGRKLLLDLSAQPWWVARGYVALRTGARLLPHGTDTASVLEVRQLAATLSDKDRGFVATRSKIHGTPGPEDAGQVRDYAKSVTDEALQKEYLRLADTIDLVYRPVPLNQQIQATAKQIRSREIADRLRASAKSIATREDVGGRFAATGDLLLVLRDAIPGLKRPSDRLALLDLSLAVETEHFADATALRQRIEQADRRQRLEWLQAAVKGLYGTGLISEREYQATSSSFAQLRPERVSLSLYKGNLDYLARVPNWASQWYLFHFSTAMGKLAEIEPKARLFVQDQLRGSGLLFYTGLLDTLLRDANRLAGIQHKLFGQEIGAGLRALNPGLARGVLHTDLNLDEVHGLDPNGIYLLPETVADLPPIAGILTAGEGNPLSHVQLLARNLGVPNVSVDKALIPRLERFDGKSVMLAVSPAGTVHLSEDADAAKDRPEQREAPTELLIKPDLDKLNLEQQDFLRLDQLRASDSGRVVGPKAAKLGELYHHYPEAVENGLAIPFGAFRTLLEQPIRPGGPSVFAWMVENYDRLARMEPGSEARQQETERFRAQLQAWIEQADPGDEFRQRLKAAMAEVFGKDGTYGVFVRSDTNVEDLPGFTGAGLNLTVANVVGFEHVTGAISRVWASPFTARAFAWRQAHMDDPEHVYPAVLLLKSVPSEKSGVLVTQDIDTGDSNWLSVSVNEGVGGAVDGQAAESLRINRETAEVRLLAQATAPERRVLLATGGMANRPVSDSERVLEDGEVKALITLSADVPQQFPELKDADGKPAPADIEFGFVAGQLRLFQIRPFLESKSARGNLLLKQMDQGMGDLTSVDVTMNEVPADR